MAPRLALGLTIAGAALPAHAAIAPVARETAASPSLLASAQPVLLALRLNGIDQDTTISALQAPGLLALPLKTWTELHLRAPATAALRLDGESYHLLGGIDGLSWRVDEASQTLVIDAPASAFAGARVALDAQAPVTTAALPAGGYANYDLQLQQSRDRGIGGSRHDMQSGLIELGGFSTLGTGRFTGLVRGDDMGSSRTRLDTSWTVDLPERMASVRLGDSVSRAGAWGRAVRFGGVQWSTDFSMQPGFLSFPLPAMRGEATLPSTVDVYVNNSHRLQSQVPAGPFDLTDVPIVTGQGQVRMVVRDLLGREQVTVQSYHVSPSLLRTGLRSYSVDLGRVREDYAIADNHYGRVVGSATERLGITDTFTRELRAEATPGQQAAGATGLWMLPGWGVLNASAVASHGDQGGGGMLGLGQDYQGRRGSASLQLSYSGRHFSQVGQRASDGSGATPRFTGTLAAGGSWQGLSLGASYVQQSPWQGARTRILSLNAATSAGVLGALGVFALRDLDGRGTTIAITLTQVLDERTSAQASASRSRNADTGEGSTLGSVSLQRSLPTGPGVGWQISADRGELQRSTAQATWQTDAMALTGGVAHSSGSDDLRAGVSGGVAWMGDSLFASRRIEGSYAVVQVGDYADVQVLQDHRPVARTDAHGRAFISGLRGYEANHIGINLSDLPFDAEVDRDDAVLTPAARTGSLLKIAVARTRAASFRLVGADGTPVPAGSTLAIVGSTRSHPVGFDGRAFLSGLGDRTRVQVRWPEHECRATVDLPTDLDEVPELGNVACE